MGRHFKVKTYHDSLKYFLKQKLSSEEQQKWVTKMLGYDFEIVYKKGKENIVLIHFLGRMKKMKPYCVPFQYYKKIL